MHLQIFNNFRSIKINQNVEKKVIILIETEGKITRNTNKSLLQNSRSSNVPNTRKPRNIPEYKILEVYKSTRVITIVLRFTRNKLIIGRQAKVAVIVNKNQIYRTLLWRFHKGKPNSKGGLGPGPLVIPLAHADLTHTHPLFGQRNGVECVIRWRNASFLRVKKLPELFLVDNSLRLLVNLNFHQGEINLGRNFWIRIKKFSFGDRWIEQLFL